MVDEIADGDEIYGVAVDDKKIKSEETAMTPMMEQYFEIKNNYKDYLLFYRLGDFYEMFFDDAIVASRALELTLTGRDCGEAERAPMCGVPFHSE